MNHVLELFRNLKIKKEKHKESFEVTTLKLIPYCLFFILNLNII